MKFSDLKCFSPVPLKHPSCQVLCKQTCFCYAYNQRFSPFFFVCLSLCTQLYLSHKEVKIAVMVESNIWRAWNKFCAFTSIFIYLEINSLQCVVLRLDVMHWPRSQIALWINLMLTILMLRCLAAVTLRVVCTCVCSLAAGLFRWCCMTPLEDRQHMLERKRISIDFLQGRKTKQNTRRYVSFVLVSHLGQIDSCSNRV